jgi:sec-independent protein translocase protein TatA
MPNLGPLELIIILVIIIIIFGVGKLPQIGGALGRGINEFRQATREGEEQAEAQATASTDEGTSQPS